MAAARDRKTTVAKDFVIYRVHIHKVKQAEIYELLESMPKSIRGLYIREALEHYRLTKGPAAEKPDKQALPLHGAFSHEFGGSV
jgi:hypothetical protein